MQNTVYECKQNGGDFFSSLTVTYFRFGNCPANGLVTEQPQYSVIICIFSTWQNTEMQLISNGLHFIFTCSLSLAQPITFHSYCHTCAIVVARPCHRYGMPVPSVWHSSAITVANVCAPLIAILSNREAGAMPLTYRRFL